MIRLAERGVIPKALRYIRRAPPCVGCLFAKAYCQASRNKGKRKSLIRKLHHTKPDKGTSADCIISPQPGLIPQVTGKPTHEKYWEGVTIVDHASDYSYTHSRS
eukprot:5524494-Ditylum_brightwellii.AAC.1